MADQHAYRLRELCLGYPRSSVTHALSLAVGATVGDEGERRTLSLLLVSWLSDDRGIDVPPQIDDRFVESVWRILRAGARFELPLEFEHDHVILDVSQRNVKSTDASGSGRSSVWLLVGAISPRGRRGSFIAGSRRAGGSTPFHQGHSTIRALHPRTWAVVVRPCPLRVSFANPAFCAMAVHRSTRSGRRCGRRLLASGEHSERSRGDFGACHLRARGRIAGQLRSSLAARSPTTAVCRRGSNRSTR